MKLVLMKILLLVSCLTHAVYCNFSFKENREHKVHNIVLYPHKSSWCNATKIIQVVSHPGCNSVKMDNNVCVGTCFSYVVPDTIPASPGYVTPYCDSCQPVQTTWKQVQLECIEGEYKDKNLTKYVELISGCNCLTCKDQSTHNGPTLNEMDEDYNIENNLIDDSLNGTADLYSLFANNSSNSTTNSSTIKMLISTLLKTFNNEDETILQRTEQTEVDQDQLKKFLQKLEATDHNIDYSTLTQLIKKVEDESHVKLNIKRLQQALLKLKYRHGGRNKLNGKNEDGSELVGPHHSVVFPKDSVDVFASGLYSKLSPRLPTTGMEQETVSPMLDIDSQHLRPATSGADISYHDNLLATNSETQNINQNANR